MKKIALGILIGVVAVVLTVGVAFAGRQLPENNGTKIAKEKSPVIESDGNNGIEVKAPPTVPAFPQLPESELTKIVFIRYTPKFAKKPCNNDGTCDVDEGKWCADCREDEEEPTTACYDFLAGSKPRWNWIEDYYYGDLSLKTPSANAVSTWKEATSGDIFGNGVPGNFDWGVYDYTNAISYGDYDDTGMCLTPEPCVIAVTAIWFRGKNIYEYDIMFDTDFFPETNFHLPTVTLHEFGHAAGLNDLYDVACVSEVMYGYLKEGEVKATLGDGDITGIQTLYGK